MEEVHTSILKLFPSLPPLPSWETGQKTPPPFCFKKRASSSSSFQHQLNLAGHQTCPSPIQDSASAMVQVKEFRIVMPMSIEEYEIGLSYTIMKMEQQNTNGKEGVEVLQQVPFEDEELGEGQFTSKVYHLQSKIPSWMKGFASASALAVHEDSWSAYPKSRTVIKCPLFSKCSLTIDTVIRADSGCSENAHDLTGKQLAAREVEIVDIASVSRDYWSKVITAPNVDLTTFRSQRTDRGPLLKDWMDSCRPVMTIYKLVTMDAPIWGLGERLEDCLIAGERALFLACHRLCFAWIDEWHGMTMEQIREMERHTDLLLKKTLEKAARSGGKHEHEGERKSLEDQIAVVGS